MKTKFIKISVLVLSLALVFGAAFAMNISADDETPATKPVILSQNVFYSDQFALMLAVDANSVAAGDVTLYVYEEHPLTGAEPAQILVESTATAGTVSGLGEGKDAYIFQVKGVGALDIAKEFYFVAVDSAEKESDVLKYSVAEYLYERLATTDSAKLSDAQKRFYNRTIAFASGAQMTLGDAPLKADSPELVSNLRYVEVVGGAINGYATALVPTDTAITPRVTNAIIADWKATTYKADGTSTDSTSSGSVTLAKDADAVKTVLSVISDSEQFYRYVTDENSGVKQFLVNNYDNATDEKLGFNRVDSGITAKYTYQPGYGMVATAKLDKTSAALVDSTISTALVDKSNATALEMSFDIKMDFPGDATGAHVYVLAEFRYKRPTDSSEQRLGRIALRNIGGRLDLCNATDGWKSYDTSRYAGVANDWFHVRIVAYNGDSNVYYYINGSDTPTIVPTPGHTIDMEYMTSMNFMIEQVESVGVTAYIDNFFFGYTKETKPTAQ